jgi:hemerythrin
MRSKRRETLGEDMPLMTWESQYSVKVQKFDHDHKHLFNMVNDLNEAMRAGKGKAVLGNVLAGLASYAQGHFAAEEAAMRRTNFPDFVAHQQEHRELTDKVQEFIGEYQKGNVLVSIDLLMFLRDWLQKHILVTDRKYGAHLNANGVC